MRAPLSPDDLIQGAGVDLANALAGERLRRDLLSRRWRTLAALSAGAAVAAVGAAAARWWCVGGYEAAGDAGPGGQTTAAQVR